MSFTVDFKNFNTRFRRLTQKQKNELHMALFDVGSQILIDAKEEPPQAPFQKGDLRGSGVVEVKETPGNIHRSHVEAGFNISYAEKVHEMEEPVNWTLDHVSQPGAKYLESKIIRFKEKYAKIIADRLKRKL